MILLDWNPGGPFEVNPTLIAGLNTGIKMMAEKIFQSDSATHKLQFYDVSIFGQEIDSQTSQGPEKLGILIVAEGVLWSRSATILI